MILEILSFALVGLIAGTLSGLLGIGGGVVTIPCLLLIFHHLDIPPQAYMHLAIGTTLASMVFNTFSASFAHFRKQSILFPIVRSMGLGTIVGALIGAYLAKVLPSHFLQIFFGVFECVLGVHFLLPERHSGKHHKLPSRFALMGIGVGVSSLSTMLGIGGGLINVPILTFFKVPVKKAIGTSSAMSFLIALTGAISFLLLGMHRVQASDSIGYIYVPAFITISVVAFFVAPLGAKLTHILPATLLRRVFGVALFIAGLSMILS